MLSAVALDRLLFLSPIIASFALAYIFWRTYKNSEHDSVTRFIMRTTNKNRWVPVSERSQLVIIAIMCGMIGMTGVVLLIYDVLRGR